MEAYRWKSLIHRWIHGFAFSLLSTLVFFARIDGNELWDTKDEMRL